MVRQKMEREIEFAAAQHCVKNGIKESNGEIQEKRSCILKDSSFLLQCSLWLHCNGIRHILSLPLAKCRILRS